MGDQYQGCQHQRKYCCPRYTLYFMLALSSTSILPFSPDKKTIHIAQYCSLRFWWNLVLPEISQMIFEDLLISMILPHILTDSQRAWESWHNDTAFDLIIHLFWVIRAIQESTPIISPEQWTPCGMSRIYYLTSEPDEIDLLTIS